MCKSYQIAFVVEQNTFVLPNMLLILNNTTF